MTRRCEQLQILLPAYAEGAATTDERALVEEHLQSCSECSATLHYLGRAGAVVASWPTVAAEMQSRMPAIDRGVYSRIRNRPRAWLPALHSRRLWSLAATVAFVLFLGGLMFALSSTLQHRQRNEPDKTFVLGCRECTAAYIFMEQVPLYPSSELIGKEGGRDERTWEKVLLRTDDGADTVIRFYEQEIPNIDLGLGNRWKRVVEGEKAGELSYQFAYPEHTAYLMVSVHREEAASLITITINTRRTQGQ